MNNRKDNLENINIRPYKNNFNVVINLNKNKIDRVFSTLEKAKEFTDIILQK